MPRAKSNVWNFFVKTPFGGKCKLCHAEIKTSGNTTNLTKHITRRHSICCLDKQNSGSHNQTVAITSTSAGSSSLTLETREAVDSDDSTSNVCMAPSEPLVKWPQQTSPEPTPSTSTESITYAFKLEHEHGGPQISSSSRGSRQPMITEAFSHIKSFKGGAKESQITNAIVYMIAKDNLPISMTEHEGFKHLMKVVAPLYSPPVHKTIGHLIDEKYQVLSNIFKESLLSVKHVTLTMDIWTETLQTVSFLGVTAHYFHNNKLNTVTICTEELDEKHTCAYLSERILKICSEWKIPHEKVTAVVTDNGKNIVKAIHDTFGKNKHLPCFAHTLDLVASSIINEAEQIREIVAKVKSIVRYFKQSVNLADELRKGQVESETGNIYKLIQSAPTRWNSEYYMLQRFVKLSGVIAPILIKYPNSPAMTDASELQIIKEILEILEPIEQVSKEISGDTYLTCSKIVPLINCLRHKVQTLSPSSDQANVLKELALKGIDKRFGAVEQVHLLTFATLLDPRFKKVHFNNAVACSSAIHAINIECKSKVIDHGEQATTSGSNSALGLQSKSSLWSFHEVLSQQSDLRTRPHTTDLYCDLKSYLTLPLVDLTTDPLVYWNSDLFGKTILKDIALKYLSIVGSSVPCERLFSQAGNIMTPKRNNLSGKRLSALLLLKSLELKDWYM